MLPQPPPDASAPLPSEHALRSRRIWRWIWASGAVSILCLLLATLLMFRSRKKADQVEAVNNARSFGVALFEFEKEFGSFPDSNTVEAVRSLTETDLDLGSKSSNDFFRQLIASGISQSESMFYARISGSHKPDGDFTKGKALATGECGFTYFIGAKITDNPSRPLVVTPMIPGTDRFDPKRFHGKAVVLKLDGSVTSYPINKDGHVMIHGRNLMDPHHPIWDGHAPVIAWPDL